MCRVNRSPVLPGAGGKSPACRRAAHVGFTLIEVLIALAVFAILAIVAYRGLAQMTQAKQILDADTRKWRDITLVLGRFEEDLSQFAARPWRDEGGVVRPALRGGAGGVDINGAQLELIRFDNGRFVHLGYRLRNNRLEMLLWDAVDLAPRSEPQVHRLLEGVERFEVRFIDATGQWQLSWPVGPEVNLPPRGVELTLGFPGGDSVRRLVALP